MADSPADPVEALAADNAPRWGLEADRLRASVAARLGITAAAPLRADRFVIGERLGAGGLGVVYAAEDPRLQRRVALKVLKQAKTPRARERLVREAQAMAALAHPNVVEVFDVLTADLDSGPALLIAMELVAGANLRTWLSAETRTWSETLAVFVQAAEGLGAAHRAGLVHRDFKPDNVLVGDDGRARVADFGLARAMMGSDCSPADEPEDAERSGALRGTSPLSSPLTADGVLVGTPAYMAPEQHGGTADAASDQFSFCVALYEALYGRRPFPGRVDASAAPALRRGPPPKRATSDVAPARLHTILARGLRLDPAQRWPNMEALANALRSISAPTRRGLPAASLAVAGAAVLVVLVRMPDGAAPDPCAHERGLGAGVWDASTKRRLAEHFVAAAPANGQQQFERVTDAVDATVARWTRARTTVCETPPSPTRDAALACLDRARTILRARLSALDLANETVVRNAAQAVLGLQDPSWCATAEAVPERLPQPSDPRQAAAVEQLRLALDEARAHRATGQLERALQAARAAEADARTLAFEPVHVEAQHALGWLQRETGRTEAARRTIRAAFWKAQEIGHDVVAADAAADMITIEGSDRAQQADAEQWVRHAEAVVARLPKWSRSAARVHQNTAIHYLTWGQPEQAVGHLRLLVARYDTLSDDPDPRRASALTNLASAENALRGPAVAVPLYRRALAEYEASLGPRHPDVALVLSNLASILPARDAERVELGQRAANLLEAAPGAAPRSTAVAWHNLGLSHANRDELDEATAALRRALEIKVTLAQPSDFDTAVTQTQLALVLARRGEMQEAQREYHDAVRRIDGGGPQRDPEHADWIPLQHGLGDVCRALDRHACAAEHYDVALSAVRRQDGDEARRLEVEIRAARAALPG